MSDLVLTVGVVADTHVPDRAAELHPLVLPLMRQHGVQHILHAGDICAPQVLQELEQVAQVTAVRGNRDWLFVDSLSTLESITLSGHKVALMHGHGSMKQYLWDKLQYVIFGYRFERYRRLMNRTVQGAKVIVFGHTHQPVNRWIDSTLYFNPGSACHGMPVAENPSVGILRFYQDGNVSGEVISMHGYRLVARKWQEI